MSGGDGGGAIAVGGVGSGFKIADGLDMLGDGVEVVIALVRLYC